MNSNLTFNLLIISCYKLKNLRFYEVRILINIALLLNKPMFQDGL